MRIAGSENSYEASGSVWSSPIRFLLVLGEGYIDELVTRNVPLGFKLFKVCRHFDAVGRRSGQLEGCHRVSSDCGGCVARGGAVHVAAVDSPRRVLAWTELQAWSSQTLWSKCVGLFV